MIEYTVIDIDADFKVTAARVDDGSNPAFAIFEARPFYVSIAEACEASGFIRKEVMQ